MRISANHNRSITFNRVYLILALVIFFIEILIAKFAHDQIIRPYVGDVLVVILIYCFVRSFINRSVVTTALCVLMFSYAIEISQYFHLIKLLGLQHSEAARLIMGTSFSWIDLAAYTAGIILVLYFEHCLSKKTEK